MAESMDIFLGFDPGGAGTGKGNFGWSICREVDGKLERVTTGLAKEAWDALNQVKDELTRQGSTRVLAAGIDAPLFWTKTGKREVDAFIEHKSRIKPIPINSLYGAAAVQGPLLAKHISDTWDSLPITESYPRVLEHQLTRIGKHQMVQRLTKDLNDATGENHERDATLGAISAWAAIRRPANWQNLYPLEPDPINPFAIPVSYWLPIA